MSTDSREAENTDVELPSPGGGLKRGREAAAEGTAAEVAAAPPPAATRAYRVISVLPPRHATTAGASPPPPKRCRKDASMSVQGFVLDYSGVVTRTGPWSLPGWQLLSAGGEGAGPGGGRVRVVKAEPEQVVSQGAIKDEPSDSSGDVCPRVGPELSAEPTLQPDFFDGFAPIMGFIADPQAKDLLRREFDLLYETEMRMRGQVREAGISEVEIEHFRKAKYVAERYLSLNNGQALLCDVCGFAPYFSFGYCPCRPGKARCIHHLNPACPCSNTTKTLVICVRDQFLHAVRHWLHGQGDPPTQKSYVFRVLAWELCRRTWRKLTD